MRKLLSRALSQGLPRWWLEVGVIRDSSKDGMGHGSRVDMCCG